VALRPDADYDLQLFDDATGAMLNWGLQPGLKIEFIAIDSNAGRRSIPHAYEARVVNQSSTAEATRAPYAIELAQAAQNGQSRGLRSCQLRGIEPVRLGAGCRVSAPARVPARPALRQSG
jgi:hypothetical protein